MDPDSSSEREGIDAVNQEELTALLREKLAITGDGNVVGKDNTVNVAKQEAGDYAIQIGQVVNVILSLDELRRVLKPADAPHPFFQVTPRAVDDETLAAARERLAALPLDTIPDPAPLPPGSRMPLSRNPLFVGRENDLRTLAAALKAGETATIGQVEIAAATGLGGIGKTQLASELAHRYGQFFAGGVFWLSFANPNAIPAEVASCGGSTYLNLRPNFGELPIDEQVQLVLAAWQSPLPRLLVFDNCEEPALLVRWRPPSGGARVLVTSRRAEWEATLGVQALPLGVLGREESVALLCKHRPDLRPDDIDLDAIADELGDLPLALHLTGSYLARYRHAVTPSAYLAQLRQPDLLQHRSLQGGGFSPTGHEGHVARTFALSYEQLDPAEPTDKLALALLTRAACFAPGEPIPRELLQATLRLAKDDPEAMLQAEDALARLVALGLLESVAEGALRLHRLLAVFVQGADDKGQETSDKVQAAVEETLLERARSLNEEHFPAPLLAWQTHLRTVTDVARKREDERAADLCNELGYYLWVVGSYDGARPYFEQALTINKAMRGNRHPATANSFNNLGYILKDLGDLEGARTCYEQALEINETVLGDHHPTTARSLHNLGSLLRTLGDLDGARPCLERSLAICKAVLGEHHRDTANSLGHLGNLFKDLRDLEKARIYYEQSLTIRLKVQGERHPDTAVSLDSLGVLLHDLGDLVGARTYYERALAIRLEMLGEFHPDTASSLDHLGLLLKDLGDLEGARVHYDRALEIRRQVLGKCHPASATSLNNLGLLLKDLGDLEGARNYIERALAIRQEVLGERHPDTAKSLNSMGFLLKDFGDLEGARTYYEQALAIRQEVLGERHPHTVTSLNNLGLLLRDLGDLDEARTYYERALAICLKVLGEYHLDTATSLNNLGILLYRQGDLRGARPYYERALAIRQELLGEHHPAIATVFNNLGMLLRAQGDLKEARSYLERALAIKASLLGNRHPDTAHIVNNMGLLFQSKGDLDRARLYFEQALAIFERVYSPDHPKTRDVQENLEALSKETIGRAGRSGNE